MSEETDFRWGAEPVALGNAEASLTALRREDLPGLFAALGDQDSWRYLPTARPCSFEEWPVIWHASGFGAHPGCAVTWVIRREAAGPILGTTSFLDLQPAHRGLEIGFTVLAPVARGTGLNRAVKWLLLRHAFETLGAIRVCFKTDARNVASQRALERLGAKREGTLRAHRLMPDGYRRDSVYYSVLDHEWSSMRSE